MKIERMYVISMRNIEMVMWEIEKKKEIIWIKSKD
jgi:hypothetical protein